MKRVLFIVKTVFLLSALFYNYAIALTVDLVGRGILGNATANAGGSYDSDSYSFTGGPTGVFNQSGIANAYASGTIPTQICFPSPFGGSNCFSGPPEYVYGSGYSEATQNSNIFSSSDYLSATVDGYSYASHSDYGSANANSYFEAYFTIDKILPYSFLSYTNWYDNRDIFLYNYTTDSVIGGAYNSNINYDMSGTLDPGTYYIGIISNTYWGNEGEFNLSFSVGNAPVPEPSTMLLLGSGLIGLAGYGRRRFKK